jgi:hypothetical protein
VQLEGLGTLKKFIDLIGSRTCDLPACSVVPQPLHYGMPPYLTMYNVQFGGHDGILWHPC